MRTLLGLLLFVCTGWCSAQDATINWDKARDLLQRSQRAERLDPADQAYLDHAKELRRQAGGGQAPRDGDRLPAQRPAPPRLIPISDLGASDRYEGEDGGLYGAGLNRPPESLRQAAESAMAQIRPLDAAGKPAAGGKIVFVSISMSNATMEFSAFKRIADAYPGKAAHVIIVDCAQGGQAMAEWAPADARPWQVAMERLQTAGVTPAQVQTAWIKLANKMPSGSLEEHATKLASDTLEVLHNAEAKFPNLRIAYLGSRIWAGNSSGPLNPEPYAYEGAFAVRRLIQRQMRQDPELGPGKSPLLLWGPYLWAEGEKGRTSDGLVWLPGDFGPDGVHPSPSGQEKVAKLLLDFVSTDPLAKPWFTGK
jgi:hypothetical protein